MPQASDIVLGGDPYTIKPGSYVRTTDGEQEGQIERWTQSDFVAGLRRAMQLEREAGWNGLNVGPVYLGQLIEPWPNRSTYVDNTIGAISSSFPAYWTMQSDRLIVATGRYVYRSVQFTNGTWSDFNQIYDRGVGTVAEGICPILNYVAVCYGSTADTVAISTSGPIITTYTGEQGRRITAYADTWLMIKQGSQEDKKLRARLSGGTQIDIPLDSTIQNIATHEGSLAIATEQSIYLLAGKADTTNNIWTAEPRPIFSAGLSEPQHDFAFLQSFAGKLYTWIGRQIMVFDPNSGGQNRQGWRPTGIEGQQAWGACIAGGFLIVSITNRDGDYEVWAHDGAGWWRINESSSSARVFPMPTGGAGDIDLISFRNGDASVAYDLYRLNWRSATKHTYPTSGEYQTPLMHMEAPDAEKVWRYIGARFAMPEVRGNSGSGDSLSITLRYSTDCGETWTIADNANISDPTQRSYELSAYLPVNTTSPYLQLEVSWTSVSDWAPALQALWCEYQRLENPARKRSWRMMITPQDPAIFRDGSTDARTSQQVLEDLWSAWSAGATITLRDIDYDDVAIERSVRIRAITEKRPATKDASHWAQSEIDLQLIEL